MMNRRLLSTLLAILMVLALFSGCRPKAPAASSEPPATSQPPAASGAENPEPDPGSAPDKINMVVMSGPTGIGAAKLMADNEDGSTKNSYNITVLPANDQVTALLSSGEADIATIATNVACNFYNKTDGSIQMLAINTLGVLYILEKGETVNNLADLRGKTIWCTGQGANPEYILNKLLSESGLVPGQDVTLEFLTPEEITANMLSSENGICMLPVPACTALLLKDQDVRQAIDLGQQWDNLMPSSLPIGCVVARTEFIEAYPQLVENFMADYEASLTYMSDADNQAFTGPGSPASLVADYGITANETIALAALPQCNLTFITGEKMRTTARSYFDVLHAANPASIGGFLPYDNFFYLP